MRLRYHGKDADTGEAVEFLIENMDTRSQLMNRENAMRILKMCIRDRDNSYCRIIYGREKRVASDRRVLLLSPQRYD